jgi:hypothetical protein
MSNVKNALECSTEEIVTYVLKKLKIQFIFAKIWKYEIKWLQRVDLMRRSSLLAL